MASSSSTIPNTATTAAADERDRKRKRGGEPGTDDDMQHRAPSRWRTRREHEIYSTKLLDALRLVRSGAAAVVLPSRAQAREVRHAADRALAVAARGRSRWSRAILLASRSRTRAHRVHLRARAPTAALKPRCPPTDAPSTSSTVPAPALARKAQALGRLVPGCRKLAFPALLSEASDYIAALEMQVRAMAALAQALAAVSPASSPSPS